MHRALPGPGGSVDLDPQGPRVSSGGDSGGVALSLLRIRPELPRGPLGRTCRGAHG